MNKHTLTLFLVLVSLISKLHSQDQYVEISPWEEEDTKPVYYYLNTSGNYETSPFMLVANKLIKLYQKEISPQSISRCPFYISCSNYAYQAINRHGLIVGIAFFIDRNLYRENIESHLHYQLRETQFGVLKLDDSYYLYGASNY